MYSRNDTPKGGLPHSDIHGSKPARGSPWLFAACHVLHRLLVPRHPPNALFILRSRFVRRPTPKRPAGSKPPCTETIVRHGRRCSVASHRREDGRQTTDARSERSSDLNHLRHGTRMLLRSLRRTHIIRINSHNVSEHSPSDLGARGRPRNPNRGFDIPDTLSRSDINRTTTRLRFPVAAIRNF